MSIGETLTPPDVARETATISLESSVFQSAPAASFYMGKVAVPGEVLTPAEDHGHGLFRAQVYIDELGWLPESSRHSDGTERDVDDDRSIRFITQSNEGAGLTRVVGVSRLIMRGSLEGSLPVEEFFPDSFPQPLSNDAVEASRFIARHEDPAVQRAVALANIRSMALQAAEVEAPHVYAVVERPLARYFGMLSMPFDVLSPPKVLPGYGNTKNMAIRFDPLEVIRIAEKPDMKGEPLAQFFNPDARSNAGIGYFDRTLTHRIDIAEAA